MVEIAGRRSIKGKMKRCRLKQHSMAKPVHRKGVSAFVRSYPVYIDKANKDEVVLIDASGLGEKAKTKKPYFPAKKNKKSAILSRTNRQWKISVW
ncbi:TPA: hypothetical protein ACQUJH_000929 [Neisseria cinerea]